ncbi:MAG TPA: HisA/HisF-related TIM barrel protein [Alphaproteobacteria bacterium]|nr:HisA/HisF-related TIM barrel protein [Alphaproteobacteria bacterium]
MLKKRVIPVLLLREDRLYKTVNFDNMRDVGSPKTAVKIYESQEADELVFLNIRPKELPFEKLVEWTNIISQQCVMPLAVGGGIQTYEEAKTLYDNGADKVLLNTINYETTSVLEKIAAVYGLQSTIIGIDVKRENASSDYQLYSHSGTQQQSRTLEEHMKICEKAGGGEFLVQSIDRDGTMQGLDIELGRLASQYTRRPVVLAGGAGNYAHLEEAFANSNISGIGCASIFHFSDSSPLRASAYLANAGFPIKKVS